MATKQPERIANASIALEIGGRQVFIGDFMTLRFNKESASNNLFIGKTDKDGLIEVIEAVHLTTKSTEALKLIAKNLKNETDEDTISDTIADSAFSGIFSRLKAVPKKSNAESLVLQAAALADYVVNNRVVSTGRDGQKMAKGAIRKAIGALIGTDKVATHADVMAAVCALFDQSVIDEVCALERDKIGFVKFKASAKKVTVARHAVKISGRKMATLSGK